MKRSHLFQAVSASMLTFTIATMSMVNPVSAQTTAPGTNNTTTGNTTDTYRDDGFDWGWLGLLGLIGLAGLAGKNKHQEPTVYRDADPVNRTRL
jgi:hypothetical protein